MQYILTEKEYQALASKGNLEDHKNLMVLIDIIAKIGNMAHIVNNQQLCLNNFLTL